MVAVKARMDNIVSNSRRGLESWLEGMERCTVVRGQARFRATTQLLLEAGATIDELNAVRKHLDRLKGGRLARAAAPARVLALILSDVVGDPLNVIASGPVSPDPTSYVDALAVLDRYDLRGRVPATVRDHLEGGERGEEPESPGPGDEAFERVQAEIVGNNVLAAKAAAAAAK
jgi:glycerate-2-kinase